MMRAPVTYAVLIAVLAITATVAADGRFETISSEAQLRVQATPTGDLPPREQIDALLADGISRDDAVQIALMSNRRLLAQFAELGVAEAELQQAGIYSNPAIDTVILWPSSGDTEVDVEVSWNIADLWRVPLRRDRERALADEVTMSVLSELLNTAADARLAWDGAIAAAAVVEESVEVLEAARDLLARMEERLEYGFGTRLDIARMTAEVAHVELELAMAEADHGIALAHLRRVLALPPDAPLEPVGELPHLSASLPPAETLVTLALEERPEVRAAEFTVLAAHHDLRLERRSSWERIRFGPAYKHTTGGDDLWGFVLDFDLPIIDNNRAQRARAAAELRAAGDRAEAARWMVREEVEAALERVELAERKERLVRETVIPAREYANEFARTHHMQMEISMLPVIETRRELAEARRMHVEARRQVAAALVELEFAVGGRLP